MINTVVITGRLTKDIELRRTTSGKTCTSFTLAVNRNKQETDFINCVAWDKVAELLERYTHKGFQIGVEGRIQTRNYDDRNGKKVYITEVLVNSISFLEPIKSDTSDFNKGVTNTQESYKSRLESNSESLYAQSLTEEAEKYSLELSDDDLPF